METEELYLKAPIIPEEYDFVPTETLQTFLDSGVQEGQVKWKDNNGNTVVARFKRRKKAGSFIFFFVVIVPAMKQYADMFLAFI